MQLLCPRTQFLLLNRLLQLVQTSNAGTKPKVRVVRPQKEIHDADQSQLAALESISMETLTDYRRSLLAVKIAKLKAKVTYIL